ncbi:hypothetical protein HK097_003598 [Rhizophlyctis rosea]|uniref:F-box domain-containing protein n=1 Tax=Rhizophlyctis rosea TaxID=64517 RepID=A0AAD5S2C9_9FUNG|nr:hypothetical protein HK097_003598 [Rhizophlyctis rosea]
MCPGSADQVSQVRRNSGFDGVRNVTVFGRGDVHPTPTPDGVASGSTVLDETPSPTASHESSGSAPSSTTSSPTNTSERPEVLSTPFIPDPSLQLASHLGLTIPGGMWPALLQINPDLSIKTLEIGRSPGYYSDGTLLNHLLSHREAITDTVITSLKSSLKLIDKLQSLATSDKIIYYDYPRTDRLPQDVLQQLLAHHIPTSSLLHLGTVSRSFRYVVIAEVLRRVKNTYRELEDRVPRIRRKARGKHGMDGEGEWEVAKFEDGSYPVGTDIRLFGVKDVERKRKELEGVRKAGERVLKVFGGFLRR